MVLIGNPQETEAYLGGSFILGSPKPDADRGEGLGMFRIRISGVVKGSIAKGKAIWLWILVRNPQVVGG